MDTKELYHTASLARLELDEKEAEKLSREVSQMLEYFNHMLELDVSNLEPTTHALMKNNRLRRDVVAEQTVDPDEMLENAPDLEDRFVLIPNVL
ncbi:MAG: Asp-tRNA(Asn)/Glu-tRNA(Gln) amidotransferase subunit GatC [Spirochaetaceae bacterium]|jgi:aspartyl-tRNA(Asn)/glutamyl-tRNA(Gln) amidotransferase subunit C|nr:Asp-tRNA(Asn)/Glu-tRNA(Gln) amidotransferase subunit GatC [Spirochaetaceae bacterium]